MPDAPVPVMLQAFLGNETVIRRIIAKYRPNKCDVDELAQEIFLKCFAASLNQDIRDPRAFLMRVAKNVAISEAKKKRHSTNVSIEDSGGTDVYTDRQQISAEDAVHSNQKLLAFVSAIAALPENERRALLMRKVDGLKFKQIATRLGVSVSTIEKRAASGLLRCNKYLREHGYGSAEPVRAQKNISSPDHDYPVKKSKR